MAVDHFGIGHIDTHRAFLDDPRDASIRNVWSVYELQLAQLRPTACTHRCDYLHQRSIGE